MSEQGKTFTTFITRELETERDRRKTLDARGLSVVTVSGSLATLLAAVSAFARDRPGFAVPDAAVLPLTFTLGAFTAAALCGLIETYMRSYDAAAVGTLRRMLADKWKTEVDARNLAAQMDVATIETLREGNNRKVRWLVLALGVQVVGLDWLRLPPQSIRSCVDDILSAITRARIESGERPPLPLSPQRRPTADLWRRPEHHPHAVTCSETGSVFTVPNAAAI